jgi:putative ABC transport system permease protein
MVAMKNALLKDTLREIRRTFSRFLSIFAIVALGVAFLPE